MTITAISEPDTSAYAMQRIPVRTSSPPTVAWAKPRGSGSRTTFETRRKGCNLTVIRAGESITAVPDTMLNAGADQGGRPTSRRWHVPMHRSGIKAAIARHSLLDPPSPPLTIDSPQECVRAYAGNAIHEAIADRTNRKMTVAQR